MSRPEKAVLLSVLLVNYNDRRHLQECLSSIRENVSGIASEIIVVDNKSSDGSQEFIRNRFPEVKLICNNINAGFARANNRGIEACRGDYILLLNTDTVMLPQALTIMLDILKSDRSAGAIGPALFTGNNGFQVSFGKKVSFFRELLQKGFLNAFYKKRLRRMHRIRSVGWLSAACLCLRSEALERSGFFDENFFLYFEDIDLCIRIKKKGYKLLFHPGARVRHIGGATTAKNKIWSRYQYRRSQLYFYRKHNSKTDLLLLRSYLWIEFLWLFVKSSLSRSTDREAIKNFVRLLKNHG